MQFVENLSDRQATEALRARIDWKYALSLQLDDSGFDFSLLSEFRDRLVAGNPQQLFLDTKDTVFPLLSITKTFTATAIMLLVEQGKLSLDDHISQHIP